MSKYKVTGSDGYTQEVEADYIVPEEDKVLFLKTGAPDKNAIPGEIIHVPDEFVAVYKNPICVLKGSADE